jgi:GDP-D-mannose dehydratase
VRQAAGEIYSLDKRRPDEADLLIGDASKLEENSVGKQTKFKEFVRLMVDADMEAANKEAHLNSYHTTAARVTRESTGRL